MHKNSLYFTYFTEAITCLKANRLRSFLALLGLLIGTASVVALITTAFLAKNAILEQFKNLGTQKLLLTIYSDITTNYKLTSFNSLLNNNASSYKDITKNINQTFNRNIIYDYHPITSFFKSTYYNNLKLQSYQLGINQNIYNSLKLRLQSGRFISDHDNLRYFAVIGQEIVDQIRQNHQTIKIGDYISIENNNYYVIGILKHWPVDPLFSYDINHSILIPNSTAQYINNSNFNQLYFDVNNNISPKMAESYLKNLLAKIIPDETLQFTNAEQIIEQLEQQAQILTLLLGTIGAISLLVGAIGVMNIMLVTIIERKAEIGLRMAIGATPREIKIQFLAETICLAGIGGLFGTVIGIFIPFVISYIAGWSFALPLSAIAFGLSISFGVGIISGFYPAVKASRLLPMSCLNT